MTSCLSSSDIDCCLASLGPRCLPAVFLYQFRTGSMSKHEVLTTIESACASFGYVIAPLHVRHHWIATCFVRVHDKLCWHLRDSARSVMVERDVTRIATSLDADCIFHQCTQQVRDSNECGVHTIKNCCEFDVALRVQKMPATTTGTVSLSVLRTTLAALASAKHTRLDLLAACGLEPKRFTHNPYSVQAANANARALESNVQPTKAKDATPNSMKMIVSGGGKKKNDETKGTAAAPPTYSKAGPSQEPVIHDVDVEESAQSLLESTYSLHASIKEAIKEAQPGSLICTETVDELFQWAYTEAMKKAATEPQKRKLNNLRIASACNFKKTRATMGTFVQPLYHSNHFVFVCARFDGFSCIEARVSDSLPKHSSVIRDRLVAQITGISVDDVEIQDVGPQLPNDCAFVAFRQFLCFLNKELDAKLTLSGHYNRDDAMKIIIVQRKKRLEDAEALLEQHLRKSGLSPVSPSKEPSVAISVGVEVGVEALGSLPHDKVANNLKVRVEALPEASVQVSTMPQPTSLEPTAPTVVDERCTSMTTKKKGSHRCQARVVTGHDRCPQHFYTVCPRSTLCTAYTSARKACRQVAVAGSVPPLCPYHCAAQQETLHLTTTNRDQDCVEQVQPLTKFSEELESGANIGFLLSPGSLCGRAGREWFIHREKPPHVHVLVWRQLSTSTRASHIRWLNIIKSMPKDLEAAPLGAAIVEVVLRMARASTWRWPTISSALSTVASALKHLPLYSNARVAIDIAKDAAFSAASKRAQHLARITTNSTDGHQALTAVQYQTLVATLKHPKARLLLQLCWAFAARTGDMRQIQGTDVVMKPANAHGRHPSAITFRCGKGAAFWGPYTVHSVLPADVAKQVAAACGSKDKGKSIFNTYDQQILSEAVGQMGMDLRAIRKGSLQELALRGASDEQLQLLSGHKRRDTLLRYLGWGVFSHSAASAAAARDALHVEVVGGATDKVRLPEAPKMGLQSGVVGNHGRRTSKAPNLLTMQAPSRKDLGIVVATDETSIDPQSWPLHVKQVNTVDWRKIEDSICTGIAPAESEMWHDMIQKCKKWCSSAEFYGSSQREYEEKEIPLTRFSSTDVRVMLDNGKIERHTGPIMGYAKGHVIPMEHKQRRRPVFEPSINDTVIREQMPPMQYPSRHERRTALKSKKYVADFDFATYFDQFALETAVRAYQVIRVRNDEGETHLFRLCRLPMGASFAPAVAQAVTWGVVAPIASLRDVVVLTMIDNVRIASDIEEMFLFAVYMFLARVKAAGIALNTMELPESAAGCAEWTNVNTNWYALTKPQLLRYALLGNKIFLGEHFVSTHLIKNSAKNIANLREAWRLFDAFAEASWQEDKHNAVSLAVTQRTTRHVCALLSLCFWLGHTLGDHISQHYVLLRAYGSIVAQSCTITTDRMSGWDTPIPYVAKSLHAQTRIFVERLLKNEAVEMPAPRQPPGHDNARYDIIIFSDACITGLGAYVVLGQSAVCLRQRWHGLIHHSATSEPTAVCRVLSWIKKQPFFINCSEKKHPRCAVVTDHIALVTGQRRWRSNNGGFSAAWALNSAFLQSQDGMSTDFFYVEGEHNIADGPSRDPTNREDLSVTDAKILIPSLKQFWHPYGVEHEQRPVWQV